MSIPPRPARALPPSPNLEQQKKQARELLNLARAGDPHALRRLRDHHPGFAGNPDAGVPGVQLSLHDAQLVLAREYGFPSWPRLKKHIETIRHTRPFVADPSYYEDRAGGLLSMHASGLPDALAQIREWHPAYAEASDDEIAGASLTLEDARLVYAREHGFESWAQFLGYIKRLSDKSAEEPFMEAFQAIQSRDRDRLRSLLRAHPELSRVRGTNGNTLLNLGCGLLCQGSRHRVSDQEIRTMFQLLLGSGADVNQANDRGWTPLHQAGYANQTLVATLLLEVGAAIDAEAHGQGGTPLAAALFWGHREVAEVLASAGIVPRNLRVAAGLGRADLIRECFTPEGKLTPEAGAARGFYRPHSGFPVWRPSANPQEILDEALVWAAKSNRVVVMPLLIEGGADIAGDPYRGTPLLWAAANGRVEAVQWLIDHGADPNQPATFGGDSHGQGVTALHLAAPGNHLAVAQLLIARGADPSLKDGLYHSTPAGWAEHSGAREVQSYLDGLPASPRINEG
ncbi:MAG: ankyrin repeat domain-containing protein [Gemmatimonadales bacterium]|nr:ankyrin repeat domain-containing protein [Gemmatimonadales bacterium]